MSCMYLQERQFNFFKLFFPIYIFSGNPHIFDKLSGFFLLVFLLQRDSRGIEEKVFREIHVSQCCHVINARKTAQMEVLKSYNEHPDRINNQTGLSGCSNITLI